MNSGANLSRYFRCPWRNFMKAVTSRSHSPCPKLTGIIEKYTVLGEAIPKIRELGEAAKLACETIRSDPVIFEVWPRYVAAREALENYVEQYLTAHEMENGNGLKK